MRKQSIMLGILSAMLVFGMFLFVACPTDGGGGDDGDIVRNVTVDPDDGKLIVKWSAYTGGTGTYKVYHHTSAEFVGTLTPTNVSNKTYAIISSLTNDTPYYIWVKAVKDSDGNMTELSKVVSGAPKKVKNTGKPGAPSLAVTVTKDNEVTIEWGPVPGVAYYDVYLGLNSDKSGQTYKKTNNPSNPPTPTPTPTDPDWYLSSSISDLTKGRSYDDLLDYFNGEVPPLYVWVEAVNTYADPDTRSSSPVEELKFYSPPDTLAGTTWEASGGIQIVFTANTWYAQMYDDESKKYNKVPGYEGPYSYTKPNLEMTTLGTNHQPDTTKSGKIKGLSFEGEFGRDPYTFIKK